MSTADAPLVMTRSQYEARVRSEVRSALDELELFFCLEDASHAPARLETEFMEKHGAHSFVRMRANDLVHNDRDRRLLKVDADMDKGLYDFFLTVDGEKLFQVEGFPVREQVRMRVILSKNFPMIEPKRGGE